MYIQDHFNVVNTGESLYSVILDEDELRVFSETKNSSKKRNQEDSEADKLIKAGAAVGVGGLASIPAGWAAKAVGEKMAENSFKKRLFKKGEGGLNAEYFKSLKPDQLKSYIKMKRAGKSGVAKAAFAASALTGLGATYGTYKYLRNKKDK